MKIIEDFFYPKDLKGRDLNYHSNMLGMSFVPVVVYSLLLTYFASIKAYNLLPAVGFSILLYLIFILVAYNRKYVLAIVLGTCIGIFINYYLTFQFGWEYGFQFHLFPAVISAGSVFRGNAQAKYGIGIIGVVSIVLLGILSFGTTSKIFLPEGHGIFLLSFNLITPLFGPTIPLITSLIKAEKLEDEIERSNQENELLLLNILPAPIVAELKNEKKSTVRLYEHTSILFADIVNFTQFSEKISPQRLVEVLNGLFSKFDELTENHKLEKIKTIGDAYMVASGVPLEKANHAQSIFLFAQDMFKSLSLFNLENDLNLQLRIGINSGPVVAGIIGKKKFSYDLWGDTVNLAARMESFGQIGKIQISGNTHELLKNDFNFEKVSNIEIKGKGKIDVYIYTPMT